MNRIVYIFTILIAILIAAQSCKHSDNPVAGWTYGFIKGYTRDDSTLTYIANTTVELEGKTYFTTKNGYYTILNILPGKHFLMAYKEGYDTSYTYIQVTAGDTSYANFFLTPDPGEPETATIKGFIRDVTSFEFITGAEISFEENLYLSNTTGRYLINKVNPDYYNMTCTKAGYDTMEVIVDARNNLSPTANFYLRKLSEPPPQDTAKVVWLYTNTGSNHVVSIPLSANPTIYGVPLQSGDLIGCFYDSLGTEACAGYATWDEISNLPIAVWGDDNTTNEKDGLSAGETFKWKIRRAADLKTFNATATYSSGADYFVPNGLTIISSIKVE